MRPPRLRQNGTQRNATQRNGTKKEGSLAERRTKMANRDARSKRYFIWDFLRFCYLFKCALHWREVPFFCGWFVKCHNEPWLTAWHSFNKRKLLYSTTKIADSVTPLSFLSHVAISSLYREVCYNVGLRDIEDLFHTFHFRTSGRQRRSLVLHRNRGPSYILVR